MSGHGSEEGSPLRAAAPARGVGRPAQGTVALGAGLPVEGACLGKEAGLGAGPVVRRAVALGAGPPAEGACLG